MPRTNKQASAASAGSASSKIWQALHVAMESGMTWHELVLPALPSTISTICEVNTRPANGAARSMLLGHAPGAHFIGLAFAESESMRDGIRASVRTLNSSDAGAAGGDRGASSSQRTVLFGDKLRTVRAAPTLDGCNVMLIHETPAGQGKKSGSLLGDMPNILQRMAIGRRSNLLVIHGPACTRKAARSSEWCAGWVELVARRLVVSVGCAAGSSGDAWCVGRVATNSACSRRPPLLPSIPEWRAVEVGGLRLGYWWRYFTLLPGCPAPGEASAASGIRADTRSNEVCLVFKNHVFESWVGGVRSVDGGRTFGSEPVLVMPTTWPVARMTHNLAIERDANGAGYLVVGGQFKLSGAARCGRRSGNTVPCRPRLPHYDGLWMATGSSWQYVASGHAPISTTLPTDELVRRSEAATAEGVTTWSVNHTRWLFNGTHPGCVERRSRYFASMAHLGTCEFDGRLSVVRHGGTLRLYARANPATHGQRFVQTAASTDEGRTWGEFRFVSVAEYDYPQGDVYFFAVSANPAHDGSLVALFPLAHKFRGCVAIAASTDGVHWSAPTPLRLCDVHGERTTHHPVQGVVREGDLISLYIHENVPGVTSDITPTPAMMRDHPYLRLPKPRLVRHTIPIEALRRWTLDALEQLRRSQIHTDAVAARPHTRAATRTGRVP